MNTTTRMEMRAVDSLIPYVNNARTHDEAQVSQLRASPREFGFVAPVLIDAGGNVIAGHGRLMAARAEGITEVPCVLVEHLTEAQRKAYILADNRLAENATWDMELVRLELDALAEMKFDLTLTGFDFKAPASDEAEDGDGHFWGDAEGETNEEYESFTEKFKPKLTTDDCYTPKPLYDAVRDWAVQRYGLEDCPLVRPFYPGGDYQSADYPDGCVVLDNPPFSILTEICGWYRERGIRFFLFCPGLTLFSTGSGSFHYVTGGQARFENGADISIGFITNLGEYRVEVAPELTEAMERSVAIVRAETVSHQAKYVYPDAVLTPACARLGKYGTALRLREEDCAFIRAMDAQREAGKTVYGGGFLLSERAAAERAAAERAAAERWELSERERGICASLGVMEETYGETEAAGGCAGEP